MNLRFLFLTCDRVTERIVIRPYFVITPIVKRSFREDMVRLAERCDNDLLVFAFELLLDLIDAVVQFVVTAFPTTYDQ